MAQPTNLPTIDQAQFKSAVERAVRWNDRVGLRADERQHVLVLSPPGTGKSTICENIAQNLGLRFHPIILANFSPADIGGLFFQTGDGTWAIQRPVILPDENEDRHVLVLFDEVGQGNAAKIAQLLSEGSISGHRMPRRWTVVLAGNTAASRAGSTALPSHLVDRCHAAILKTAPNELVAGLAERGAHPLAQAYARWTADTQPDELLAFDPQMEMSATLRSYAKLSQALFACEGEGPDTRRAAISMAVGDKMATHFGSLEEALRSLPRWADIAADPAGAPLPAGLAAQYAAAYTVAAALSPDRPENSVAAFAYLGRLPQEIVAGALSLAKKRFADAGRDLAKQDGFPSWAIEAQDLTRAVAGFQG